jgi:hypothetical protein
MCPATLRRSGGARSAANGSAVRIFPIRIGTTAPRIKEPGEGPGEGGRGGGGGPPLERQSAMLILRLATAQEPAPCQSTWHPVANGSSTRKAESLRRADPSRKQKERKPACHARNDTRGCFGHSADVLPGS